MQTEFTKEAEVMLNMDHENLVKVQQTRKDSRDNPY